MTEVYVGAGSNIEPEENLRSAMVGLAAVFGVLRLSPVYRSAPVGLEGPDFLNLVIGFDTGMDLADVIAELERIEVEHGRERGQQRFTSRTLDLDLLLYGDRATTESGVTLPRDEVSKFAFVLRPLSDLAPDLLLPGTGRNISQLWAAFDDSAQTLEPNELRLVEE